MTSSTGTEPGPQRRQTSDEWRRESINLDRRYGAIGIASVAAAMRYAGVSKNPAYAPVVPRIDPRHAEAAA